MTRLRQSRTNFLLKKLIILTIALIAFGFIKMADDIVATLGLSQYTARLYVMGDFVGDFTNDGETVWKEQNEDDYYYESDRFKIPYVRKALPSIIAGDKVGAAKSLCEYARTYVNSEEFMTDYLAKKEKARPTREPWKPRPEDINNQEERITFLTGWVAEGKKQKLPAAETLSREKELARAKVKLADMKDPNPYITRWQKAYPEDPSPLIRAKLEEYLAVAATVDFAATVSGPKNKFTNPVYEKKPAKWKAIYRAGKDVNAAVTAFVKDWLKGEIIAKNKVKMPKDPEKRNSSSASSTTVAGTVANTNSGSGTTNNAAGSGNNTSNGSGPKDGSAGSGTSNNSNQAGSTTSSGDPAEPVKKVKKASMLLKRIKDKID